MSTPSIDSNNLSYSRIIPNVLLQQLTSPGTSSKSTNSFSNLMEDLVTLSPAAQQMLQAPTAVVKAMGDLFAEQKDTPGDLLQLKTYFQQNPQSLANVLSSLEGGTLTYSNSGTLSSSGDLLTYLMNNKSSVSQPGSLINMLLGTTVQDSLFSSLVNSGNTSNSGSFSFFA